MSDGRAGLWPTPDLPSTRLRRGGPNISAGSMTKADKDKAERLAAALRDNLRRRKAQARGNAPGDQKKDPTQAASE